MDLSPGKRRTLKVGGQKVDEPGPETTDSGALVASGRRLGAKGRIVARADPGPVDLDIRLGGEVLIRTVSAGQHAWTTDSGYLQEDKGAAEQERERLCALFDKYAGADAADGAEAELVGADDAPGLGGCARGAWLAGDGGGVGDAGGGGARAVGAAGGEGEGEGGEGEGGGDAEAEGGGAGEGAGGDGKVEGAGEGAEGGGAEGGAEGGEGGSAGHRGGGRGGGSVECGRRMAG